MWMEKEGMKGSVKIHIITNDPLAVYQNCTESFCHTIRSSLPRPWLLQYHFVSSRSIPPGLNTRFSCVFRRRRAFFYFIPAGASFTKTKTVNNIHFSFSHNRTCSIIEERESCEFMQLVMFSRALKKQDCALWNMKHYSVTIEEIACDRFSMILKSGQDPWPCIENKKLLNFCSLCTKHVI